MSYILDALKKSEKERQQGTVPDLMTVQDAIAQEPKKRSLWSYLLLVALLMNAVLLAWWLVPWQSKKPKLVIHSTAGQQLESKVIESPSPGLTKTTSSGVKDVEGEHVPKTKTTLPKTAAKPGKIVQQNQPVQAITDLQREVPGKPMPTVDTGGPREVSPSVPQQTPVMSNVASVPKAVENKIYNLNDLPLSIQQSLPTITISVSLYSDDPASRMTKINGQMMREGEYVTASLKLEEITPDGVIFSYQNYRFRVGPK